MFAELCLLETYSQNRQTWYFVESKNPKEILSLNMDIKTVEWRIINCKVEYLVMTIVPGLDEGRYGTGAEKKCVKVFLEPFWLTFRALQKLTLLQIF